MTRAAFDEVRGVGVLFGGRFSTSNHSPLYDNTWTWDGQQWQQRFPVHVPHVRAGHAMTFDRGRGVVVMAMGGIPGDTWTWDGLNWTEMHPATMPPGRIFPGLVYDEARSVCVMFGGEHLTDTWEWDGVNWTMRSPAHWPVAQNGYREASSMVYDAARQKTVLYSGLWTSSDVWEYDGSDWTQMANSPAGARTGHVMYYDRSRAKIVVYGGDNGSYYPIDTWEYDGVTWSAIAMPSPPAGRRHSGHFYDSWRGNGVMTCGDRAPGDTWVYSAPSPASVVSYAQGCPGPIGIPAIAVVQRPILGGTYEIHVSNLAPQSLTFMMTGWSIAGIDIGTINPLGSGCFLRASPDYQAPMIGTNVYTLVIPNDPAFLGAALHNQAVQLELAGPGPSLVSISVSDAVRMVMGNP